MAPIRLARRAAAAAAVASGAAVAATESAVRPQLPPIESLKLLQVQSTFRHGARTPMEDMGEMPVEWRASEQRAYARARERHGRCCSSLSLLHEGATESVDALETFFGRRSAQPHRALHGGGLPGILTNVGLGQANTLGASLRHRYVDPDAAEASGVGRRFLLPAAWVGAQQLVAARSTLVERTVFTASGVLAGLFPADAAAGTLCAQLALNVPPGSRGAEEFMVINTEQCPRLAACFRQGQRLSTAHLDAQQHATIAAAEADDVADPWIKIQPEWKLIAYRDHVACRRAEGKEVPPHVAAVEGDLERAAAVQMHQVFEAGAAFVPAEEREATRVGALRLGIGRMVARILDTLEAADGKLHLYSGHDWTISPLLMCLCRPDDALLEQWPPFCSEIAIELWGAGAGGADAPCDGRYVRVLYNGAPLDLPCSAAGEGLCRLHDFRAMMQIYCVRPDEFARECRAGGDEPAAPAGQAKVY